MRECRVLCSYDTIWFENTDPYFSAHIGLRSLCPALAFSEVQAIRRMGVQTMLDRWPEAAAEDLANGLEVLLDGNLVKRDVRGDVHAADLLPLLQHASHDIRRAARLLIPIVGVTESLPLNQERRGVRL